MVEYLRMNGIVPPASRAKAGLSDLPSDSFYFIIETRSSPGSLAPTLVTKASPARTLLCHAPRALHSYFLTLTLIRSRIDDAGDSIACCERVRDARDR